MPISVKDYTWRETEEDVNIVLPLKAVKTSKVDILSTDRFIKVSYPPYLFEVHLQGEVAEEQSSAKIGDGVVRFRLVKKERGLWGRLTSADSEDKAALWQRRVEAIEKVEKTTKEDEERRARKKREEEQYGVKQQMKLEQEERERIEREKEEERKRTEIELQRMKEEREKVRRRRETEKKKEKKLNKFETKSDDAEIWKEKKLKKSKPPPRRSGHIEVVFTPRVFPTPARESREAEEQEWLAKQAAARRITQPALGEEEEGGDLNERNPEFLKDKGVGFFKARDYESAVNAFSEGIRLNPNFPQLFSNRAACYLALWKLEECMNDCCRALELYFPIVPANYTARAKVFVRRGTVYMQTGRLDLALQDYEAALKLLPGDESLRLDTEKLQRALVDSEHTHTQ